MRTKKESEKARRLVPGLFVLLRLIAADSGRRVGRAKEFGEGFDLCLLAAIGFEKSIDLPRFVLRIGLEPVDLGLLFIDGIDQHDADAFVVHALDLAVFVGRCKKRFDRCHLFGNESKIANAVVLPVKIDRPKPADQTEPGGVIENIFLIPK